MEVFIGGMITGVLFLMMCFLFYSMVEHYINEMIDERINKEMDYHMKNYKHKYVE